MPAKGPSGGPYFHYFDPFIEWPFVYAYSSYHSMSVGQQQTGSTDVNSNFMSAYKIEVCRSGDTYTGGLVRFNGEVYISPGSYYMREGRIYHYYIENIDLYQATSKLINKHYKHFAIEE